MVATPASCEDVTALDTWRCWSWLGAAGAGVASSLNEEQILGFSRYGGAEAACDLIDSGSVRKGPNRLARNQKVAITETRATCMACGDVWFYGKEEEDQVRREGGQFLLETACCLPMACCSPTLHRPESTATLTICPKCNSSAIQRDKVTHYVERG